MANKRPSNLPYLITALAAIGIILLAWAGRDWFGAKFVQIGVPAPEFHATTLNGQSASLADYEGKVVLLNIWATWCGPCRVEMPSMERLYQKLDRDDFEIVAVSVDAAQGSVDQSGNPGGDIRAFADSLSLTFPILHDPEGRIQRIYQTTGVPESFVIGKDGIIYQKVTGQTDWDTSDYMQFMGRLLDGAE
jgi:cytochrome c biogenesis protein CcmG, thiol:disulfide interchange protein DsbE